MKQEKMNREVGKLTDRCAQWGDQNNDVDEWCMADADTRRKVKKKRATHKEGADETKDYSRCKDDLCEHKVQVQCLGSPTSADQHRPLRAKLDYRRKNPPVDKTRVDGGARTREEKCRDRIRQVEASRSTGVEESITFQTAKRQGVDGMGGRIEVLYDCSSPKKSSIDGSGNSEGDKVNMQRSERSKMGCTNGGDVARSGTSIGTVNFPNNECDLTRRCKTRIEWEGCSGNEDRARARSCCTAF